MSKKIIAFVAPIVLLFGPLTQAASVKNCDKDGLACEKSAFDVGLTALYLQAYSSSLSLNSIHTSTSLASSSATRNNASGNAPWNWGGAIDLRYHFSNKNDVNLNWMYYALHHSATTAGRDTATFENDSTSSQEIKTASGRIRLNSVNAEFAQSFDLTPRSTARLFAGGQYLNVKKKVTSSLVGVFVDQNGTRVISGAGIAHHTYEGVGPRIGLDANYKLKGNFSVFANSAATILLARRTLSSSGFSGNSSLKIRQRSDIAIPELEAKLGLTYNQPFVHGTVSISAGWSVINYFSLLDADRNNLTLSGPFLQGRWVG